MLQPPTPYLKIHTDPVHTIRGFLFSSPAIGKRGKGARAQSILGSDAGLVKGSQPHLLCIALSSACRTLPFAQIPLCFPDGQDLPHPLRPVLWCGHTMILGCAWHCDLPGSSWRAGAMPHTGLRVLGVGLLTLSRRFRALSCNTGCRVGLRGRLCSSGSGTGSSRKDTEAMRAFPSMPHPHLLLQPPQIIWIPRGFSR